MRNNFILYFIPSCPKFVFLSQVSIPVSHVCLNVSLLSPVMMNTLNPHVPSLSKCFTTFTYCDEYLKPSCPKSVFLSQVCLNVSLLSPVMMNTLNPHVPSLPKCYTTFICYGEYFKFTLPA